MTEAADGLRSATPQPVEAPASLEQRVRRLEDTVAVLQDTRQLEERVVERVARIQAQQVAPRESAGLIVDASRRLLPAAVSVFQNETAAADAQVRSGAPPRRSWLLFDMVAELRAMLHMFVDPRYRLSWQGRLIPLALFLAILLSWIWVPGISLLDKVSDTLATLIIKLVDLVLAYFLYKVLSREAYRYRATAPGLPPDLRP